MNHKPIVHSLCLFVEKARSIDIEFEVLLIQAIILEHLNDESVDY